MTSVKNKRDTGLIFKAKKKFGQNFLIDKNIAAKIVAAADLRKNDEVWEIGSGKGILTEKLLKTGCRLTCFEIDRDLISLLEDKFSGEIQLIPHDVFKADWEKLFEAIEKRSGRKPRITIVANIPYNITSPLIYRLTAKSEFFKAIVLMIQKEVAERIIASPGNKDYGLLSLRVQYHFNVKRLFNVPPHLFRPQPEVISSVIKMIPRKQKIILSDPNLFWRIVEAAFHHRRKTLKNNLRSILSQQELQVLTELMEKRNSINESISQDAGIERIKFNLTNRGETLDEKDYLDLYHLIRNIRKLNQ